MPPNVLQKSAGSNSRRWNERMTQPLKAWYAVATPHEDIRKGRLSEAVFAANVLAVVQGTAPEVYLHPEEFFRNTYLTSGLSTVLNRVAGAQRRGGETGDRIIRGCEFFDFRGGESRGERTADGGTTDRV